MLKDLCEKYTDLTKEDIKILENFERILPYICKLSGADTFIDCFVENSDKGIVVAHGRPEGNSLYSTTVTGHFVLPVNEPIVFFTRKTGTSIRDAKAVSQEAKIVIQKTVPIKNTNGRIIAVLVEESDMTNDVKHNKKMEQLVKITEGLTESYLNANEGESNPDVVKKSVMMHEMHHRIKNNLQTISSILSMQERRSTNKETKEVLREDMNRINSIASIYENLLNTSGHQVEVLELLKRLADNMMGYATTSEKRIVIKVNGNTLYADSQKAISMVLAVNELLTNSIQHGYEGREEGRIEVSLSVGNIFSTIIVSDDGNGFQVEKVLHESKKSSGLGLALIRMIVKDDLKGDLSISSGREGTTVSFDMYQ
jgi:two-component sensor histidine kinase